MKFTEIDRCKWPRNQMYHYFSQMAPTGYSLTVDVDITKMIKPLKQKGLKFFPAYLWIVTKTLNQQIEFKTALKDGKIGYYDILTPIYATFHEDDKTFSLMWTAYQERFKDFYDAYVENQKKYGEQHGALSQNEMLPPENCYTISEIPWIPFKHFTIHSYQNQQYYFPTIEAGRFEEKNGVVIMPLSITCHHATTDGYHVTKWLESLQHEIENFEAELLF